PDPLIFDKSTPSSRAKTRTEGEACAFLKASLSIGAAAGALGAARWGGSLGDGTACGARVGAGAAASARSCFAACASAASSMSKTVPSLTLSPSLTFISFTTPAEGDGTSMVALSDSSVTSGSSAFTVSPGFTKTSMIGTSLKSPMSGTLTSIARAAPAGGICLPVSFDGAGAARAAAGPAGAETGADLALAPVAAVALDDAPVAAFAPAPSASSVSRTVPSLTLSPSLIL